MGAMNAPSKSTSPDSPSLTGKIVVIGIFVVALAAASFALYWNMSRSRRALAFWGADAVRLIQKSERVEILPLQSLPLAAPNQDSETFEIAGQLWGATHQIEVTKARGLIHARHALTTDASYEPGEPTELRTGKWTHAIRFSDSQGSVVLLLAGERVGNYQTQREWKLIPKVADGWRIFVNRETNKK